MLNDFSKHLTSLTTKIEVLSGVPNVLCALKQKESDFSTPLTRLLYFLVNITDPPNAPSTCSHKSYFFETFDISSILSNAHKTVVPAVALI